MIVCGTGCVDYARREAERLVRRGMRLASDGRAIPSIEIFRLDGRAIAVDEPPPLPLAKQDKTAVDPEINEALVDYLKSILTPEQMARVRALAAGEDAPAPVAQDAFVMRRDGTFGRRVPPPTPSQRTEYERRFPNANRLGLPSHPNAGNAA